MLITFLIGLKFQKNKLLILRYKYLIILTMKSIRYILIVIAIFMVNSSSTSNAVASYFPNYTNLAKTPESNYETQLQTMGMVDIAVEIPACKINLKYASEDNFVGVNFYGDQTKAYVRPECIEKLKKAYRILQEKRPGYSFVIFDAIRSVEAQKIMWEKCDKPVAQKFWYVSNPYTTGSLHNYGMAIDLNIIDENGKQLNMGTNFDYFGALAHTTQTEYFFHNGVLSKEQYENRLLIKEIMERAGFTCAKCEWWHFNACTIEEASKKYPIYSANNS